MRRLINIQNEENECLIWCLLRYLNLENRTTTKIRNDDQEFSKQLKFKSMKFVIHEGKQYFH